jgi:hypothetical protein
MAGKQLTPEVRALRMKLKAVHMATYRVGDDDIPAALEKVREILGESTDRKSKRGRDRQERGGFDRSEN